MPVMNDKPTKLMVVVVQSQDAELVERGLLDVHCFFAKLPSAGGFLREKNVTFLIGCRAGECAKVLDHLAMAAKRRISYLATPVDESLYSVVVPTETVIGGATVFELDLERFEEF